MTDLEKYSELLALTQLFLLQEYPPGSKATLSRDTFSLFQTQLPATPPQSRVFKEPLQPAPLLYSRNRDPDGGKPVRPPTVPPFTEPEKKLPSIPPVQPPKALEKTAAIPDFLEKKSPSSAECSGLDQKKYAAFFARHYPSFPLRETIPDDAEAKRNKSPRQQRERAPGPALVWVLTSSTNPEELAFLDKMTQAISSRFIPAALLKKDKWESEEIGGQFPPAYILAEKTSWNQLQQHQKVSLEKTPLLLLEAPSAYLKDSALKATLWKAICQFLASSQRTL